jgi:antitoxin ParD1/3/4
MPGMDVRLNPELENIIRGKLRTGQYGSASDVVDAALRLLERRDEVREKVAQGLQSLRDGKGIDENSAFDELRSRHEEYKRTKRP